MRRCNFSLSPAYARNGANAGEAAANTQPQMPAWAFLSAILLATTIGAIIWYG
jgi:hypothetical protein